MNAKSKLPALVSWFSLAAIALLFCSCAVKPPAVLPYVAGKPAAATPSPVPTLEQARRDLTSVSTSNALVESKVTSARAAVVATQEANRKLSADVDKLRKQKQASEFELGVLSDQLDLQAARAEELLVIVDAARQEIDKSKAAEQALNNNLVKVQKMVADKEGEANQLRGQLDTAESSAVAYRETALKANEASKDETKRADKAEGVSSFKTKIILGLGSLLAVAVLLIVALFRGKIPI